MTDYELSCIDELSNYNVYSRDGYFYFEKIN